MPKVRHAKSLLQTSLDVIAYIFVDCISTSESGDENDMEETSTNPIEGEGKAVSKCFSNPFQKLPSACLVQILDTLRSTNGYGWLKRFERYALLITPQAKILDLSILDIKDKRTVFQLMQLAADQCSHLTDLQMMGVSKCTSEYYHKFLPQFKHLQVLNVSLTFTSFDDSCMKILGPHCQHLRELDVRCCNVTDDGIERLFGQCKSIEELIIFGTKVTPKGVDLALRNLPLLKILGHWKVMEALGEMKKKDLEKNICPKYALVELRLLKDKDSPLASGALCMMTSLCPSVTHVELNSLARVTDSELLGLKALESLSKLTFCCNIDDQCRITFDGGLAPLLLSRGNSLKTLELEALPIPVRLGVIVKCCPNLKCLALNCEYSTLTWQEETEADNTFTKQTETNMVLNQLEELRVSRIGRLFRAPEPPIKELLLVLTTTLKTLALANCDSITDNSLRQVYQLDSLKGLKQLEFLKCNKVTKVGIDLFLNDESSLERLGVYECDSVSEEDFLDWQERAKNLNWDL